MPLSKTKTEFNRELSIGQNQKNHRKGTRIIFRGRKRSP